VIRLWKESHTALPDIYGFWPLRPAHHAMDGGCGAALGR
jgi:hypothetical protein